MRTPMRRDQLDGPGTVAAAIRLLAQGRLAPAPGALPEVLRLVCVLLRAEGATLRTVATDGSVQVLATSGRPVAAVREGGLLDTLLVAGGVLRGVLTITGAGVLDPGQERDLDVLGDLLALALPAVAAEETLLRQWLVEEELARAELAAQLHEGPGGALVAARYALDLAASGRTETAAALGALQAALTSLDGALAELRPRAVDGDLRAALSALAARRRREGQRGLRLRGQWPRALPPALAVAAYRLILDAARASHAPLVVTATSAQVRGRRRLNISVSGAEDSDDWGSIDRWARRVTVLGGRVEWRDDGVTMDLPADPPAALPAPEGRA